MLKVNKVEKNETVLPKYQNGSHPNIKVTETLSKKLSTKTKIDPRQKGTGNKVKDKTVPPTVGPRDSQRNPGVPNVSEKRHFAAPKRKMDSRAPNTVPAFKMKKTVAANKTPTE